MEEWNECRLKDIVEINPTESLKKGTVAKKIGMDILQPYCRSIPSYSLEPYTGGTKFKNGDTIMARITPCLENGKTAMVNILEDNEIGFGSTEYIVFRAKNNVTDPYFIYYLVTSDCIRNPAIKSMVGSSGRQRVQTDVVANLSINLPPLPTQQKIAAILSSLDDKIELNNKINTNLEQQAQALFKNWFVDDSEKFHTIGDYIVPKRGKNLLSKDAIHGEVPVVAGGLEPATYHNTANTKAPVLTISASGANAGFVNLWNIPVWSSDSSYIDSGMTNDVYFWYILLKLRQKEIFDSQTGSAQPHIYPQHISVMPISELDFDKVSKFTKQVTPFFEQIGANQQENLRLIALRDTLLPKLMNGDI